MSFVKTSEREEEEKCKEDKEPSKNPSEMKEVSLHDQKGLQVMGGVHTPESITACTILTTAIKKEEGSEKSQP